MIQERLGRERLGNEIGTRAYGLILKAAYESGLDARFELPDFVMGIRAVLPGHHDIKNEQIDLRGVQNKFIDSLFAVTSLDNLAAGLLKYDLDETSQVRVVIRDQYGLVPGNKCFHIFKSSLWFPVRQIAKKDDEMTINRKKLWM